MTRLLGKREPKLDARTFRLAEISRPLTIVPPVTDFGRATPAVGALGNDQYGDCGIVGVARSQMLWSANNGQMVTITADQVIKAYLDFTGGEDSGVYLLDVLKTWRKSGFFGSKIDGFATVDMSNPLELRQALLTFGTVYTGFALPREWQEDSVWDAVPNSRGVWGGHAMAVEEADEDGVYTYTWGYRQRITYAGCKQFGDEGYAMISGLWLPRGVAPNQFDRAALDARLAAL